MDETIQLGFKIALVWALGFVIALTVRALFPSQSGVTLPGAQGGAFVPYSKIGFWTCMLASVTVTALVVIRAMLADFSVGGR